MQKDEKSALVMDEVRFWIGMPAMLTAGHFLFRQANLHNNEQLGTRKVVLTRRLDVVHGSGFAIAHSAHPVKSRVRGSSKHRSFDMDQRGHRLKSRAFDGSRAVVSPYDQGVI